MSSPMFHRAVAGAALCFALFASGCGCSPGPTECLTGDEGSCDGGRLNVTDSCNSAAEASSNPDCKLVAGDRCPAAKMGPVAIVKEGYISTQADGGRDTDFYLAELPLGLTPRCLLHVNAGYSAPQSAVSLRVNVLKGPVSVMSGFDKHGAAAPKPIDLITPFSESGAKLLIQLDDLAETTQVKVDNRNNYSLRVEMIENPDPNEPNDTTPTVIPLTTSTDGVAGAQSGYLATTDDVDMYSFEVKGAGRQIIYLHIGSPATTLSPPPPFRVSYVLQDPAGTQIAEGVMDNEFLQVDLKSARLAPGTGVYKLIVKGFKSEGQTAPVPGDLRLRYDVEIKVILDLDMNEPNDDVASARTVNVANGTTTLTGRISYIADEEWFKLVVGASSTQRTLRYEIAVSPAAGRFPPLSPLPARQSRLVTQVTAGTTAQDRKTNCINDPAVCPRSFTSVSSPNGQLVSALCGIADPPQCLWGERNEEAQTPALKQLKNFVGAVPVPTAGAAFMLMFRDQGQRAVKYADDQVWSIRVTLQDDADEQSRLSGAQVVNLGGASTEASGVISYGYSFLLDNDPEFDVNRGDGVRGPNDYDPYESDSDLFQFNYSGTGDQSWAVEWELENSFDGGSPPADLALDVTLCGSPVAPDGGLCGNQRRFVFAASYGAITPWYLPITNGSQRVLFTKTKNTVTTTVSATPVSCTCFAAKNVSAGRFFVNASGIRRVNNQPLNYKLRQSVAPYPNGISACPVTDGGCRFAGQ